MLNDFPINQYPTKGLTNSETLYGSLGSFWTQLFNEKGTIKGYTLAQAEELIQSYMNLVEVIRSYSVRDIPILHTERWYPIRIKRSQYNNVTLLFRSSDDPEYAVFGPQIGTPTDKYYEGVTFRFGYPKTPVAEVYGIDIPEGLKDFSVLTNRVINPSLVLAAEVDYRVNSNVCYFNKDIFSMASVAKYNVFDENGTQVFYTSKSGEQLPEQEVILWAYNAGIDASLLYENFGYIFELNLSNDVFFKEILKSVMSLFVDGPTVQSIRALACAFLGVSPVTESEETIEDSYIVGDIRFIVTDKNVYRCNKYYTILSRYRQTTNDPNTIQVGAKVYAGDVMVDAAEYFDYVQSGDWWRNGLAPKAAYDASTGLISRYPIMSFPPHLFVGNNKFHFIFKNELELVTRDAAGLLHFPVIGDVTDVASFHTYINDASRITEISNKLGVGVGQSVIINPLEFIFQNFLKQGTSLIKLNFATSAQAYVFTTFYSVIKDCFPKHVYLMFYLDFALPTEELSLNNTATVLVDGVALPANSDGSSATEATLGYMTPASVHSYKTDIKTRLFSMSSGIDLTSMSGVNYQNINNYDGVTLSGSVISCNASTALTSNGAAIEDGTLLIPITPGSSTREYNSISLLKFA